MTHKLRAALTPAEKQKAYRERQRENAKGNNSNVTNEDINKALEESLKNIGFYEFSHEQKKQFVACTILKIMPELANKELMTTLFITAMAGE